VLQTTTHDTASAVLSVPAREKDFLYISSGTWSLMGVEQREADCSEEAMEANLTNEGGYEYRYRFLKNIMGLWMIQSVRHEYEDAYSFAQLCEMAEACRDFPSRVDVNDEGFLSPKNMTEAIRNYCRNTNQPVPETPGEIAAVIYQSLAKSYGSTVQEIEKVTGRTYTAIHIVGGGSNAEYLNRLTAQATGKTVYSGPVEATAIGNVVVQMRKSGEFASLEEARRVIAESFPIRRFTPEET
jgi:rhamnulokinase